MKRKEILFSALHNPMIEESDAHTMSVHRSREGAEKAIIKSMRYEKRRHKTLYENIEAPCEWDRFHWWGN